MIATNVCADGIASACILVVADDLSPEDITFPPFGDVSDEEYCLDMPPRKPDYKGTVIDHHPQSRIPKKERKYKLVWDVCPTSVIMFRSCMEDLEEDKYWWAAIGAVGDGRPEDIPVESFIKCPELLDRHSLIYPRDRFSIATSRVYELLSSSINAYCRTRQPHEAVKRILSARTPMDIIEDREASKLKEILREEQRKIFWDIRPITIGDMFVVGWYESEYDVENIVAYKLYREMDKTVIALNLQTKTFRIRGAHTNIALHLMAKGNITSTGSGGYGGGHLTDEQTEEDLVKALRGWWR